MNNITDLEEYRSKKEPHVVINTPDGKVRVLSLTLLESIVNGNISITQVEEWEQVTISIIKHWLELIRG